MNLARIRCILETKYRSDNDSGFYYVCADGTRLSLTPLRMREWALAIVGVLFSIEHDSILARSTMGMRLSIHLRIHNPLIPPILVPL